MTASPSAGARFRAAVSEESPLQVMGAITASATVKSMARARPTISSSRASELRTTWLAVAASRSPRRGRRYGPMTIARPVDAPCIN